MKTLKTTLLSLFSLLTLLFGMSVHAKQEVTYHITAQDGSVLKTVSATGVVESSYRYAPFGEQLVKKDLMNQRGQQGFVGGIHEAKDLTYLKHRYYNPVIGRFYQPDPVTFLSGSVGQINRYQYAANDPFTFKDSNGLYIDKNGDYWGFTDPISSAQVVTQTATNFLSPFDYKNDVIFLQNSSSGGLERPYNIFVMVNDNHWLAGSHVGMILDDLTSTTVYDPGGSFHSNYASRSSGGDYHVWKEDGHSLDLVSDYMKYQLQDGPKVFLYSFPVSAQTYKNISSGCDFAGLCAFCSSGAYRGKGPFPNDLKFTPSGTNKHMQKIMNNESILYDYFRKKY